MTRLADVCCTKTEHTPAEAPDAATTAAISRVMSVKPRPRVAISSVRWWTTGVMRAHLTAFPSEDHVDDPPPRGPLLEPRAHLLPERLRSGLVEAGGEAVARGHERRALGEQAQQGEGLGLELLV